MCPDFSLQRAEPPEGGVGREVKDTIYLAVPTPHFELWEESCLE